ncbi:MAG: PilZ domain-containing protein, partial [Candidatus Acidiferrales bacterium]
GQGLRVEFTELAEVDRRHLLELLYPSDRDRRAARRVLLASQIRTRVGGQQIVGYSRDVSVGGVYVETETPPAAGSEVTLRFKLKPEAEILECRAVVAYSVPEEGMGLRFLELPGSVRQAVEEFVGRREPED